ncbi:MAG: hypothetical protein WAT21_11755 [Saprospiraceae bacterium]
MANYYIYKIDSAIDTFSQFEAGVNFKFETTTLGSDVHFENDDRIIGIKPPNSYYLLSVIDYESNELNLQKQIEINSDFQVPIENDKILIKIDLSEYESILKNVLKKYINLGSIHNFEKLEIPDLKNLIERFADWFIKLDGTKYNYYTDSFGSNRDKLLEQLSKYESIYKEQFGTYIFNLQGEEPNKFINELEKNLYIENGDFFQFSLKTSTHMPRAILGKNNYIKFLRELFAYKDIPHVTFNLNSFQAKAEEAGLIFFPQLIQRFVASLCTKPFVICSGLSGSGKTKLAQAFAQWITVGESQYVIVPVGADWTNREPLLGYPNALNKLEYVSPENGVLDLMIRAKKNIENTEEPTKPYFLILDEMNLSHVERYFADFLSTMESGDVIPLHKIVSVPGEKKIDIPQSLKLPKNLFIIGTVNIDETTYMFSPKVLDRANTIEFRLTTENLEKYITSDIKLNMELLKAQGANMSDGFMTMALKETDKNLKLSKVDLKLFFSELKKSGAEFGYRTASEIGRLMHMLKELGESGDNLLDIAIMQKLLPKLHGSRSKLNTVLTTLAKFCVKDAVKDFDGKDEDFRKTYFIPFDELPPDSLDKIKYKISFEKISRMHKNAMENGFTSYAEA